MLAGIVGIAGLVGEAAPAGPISIGSTTANATPGGIGNGFMVGVVHVAGSSGTVNNMHMLCGGNAASSQFRLVIYAATASNVWGAKLAETAVITGTTNGVTKTAALLSPLSIVAGQRYALCIHSGANGPIPAWYDVGSSMRAYRFTDAFADGALASAGSLSFWSASFMGHPCVWATTT